MIDLQFTRQEYQRDLAAFSVGRLERRDVPIDDGFAHRITQVGTSGDRHINSVKLYFELVVTERENAKLALIIPIDPVGLRRGNDLMFLGRSGRLRVLRSSCKGNRHDARR